MRRRWLILLAVLIGIGLAGCYTMFSHPNVGMGESVHGGGRHCSECHTGDDYYSNNYPYYYDSYWRDPSWWAYYGSPWWYYDYWDGGDGGGTQLPVDRSQYWDSRERPPSDRPVVVPGASAGTGGGTSTPSATDDKKSDRGKTDTKSSGDTGKAYWNRKTRPPKPPAQPEKPKTAEKKSEEKKTKERE